MPNLYCTLEDAKEVAPSGIGAGVTDFDNRLLQLIRRISRFIDRHCERVFYPEIATRVFDGSGEIDQFIGDLLSITSVSTSDDDGDTYTALVAGTDYIPMRGGDFTPLGSYNKLRVDRNSTTLSHWTVGQRSLQVVGTFAFTEARADAFIDTLDTVQNSSGIDADDLTLTVADIDGLDTWGITPRIGTGNLLQIGSELIETTATDSSTGVESATLVRGRNGSTAAVHDNGVAVNKWEVTPIVKEACIEQVIHQYERGSAGFSDTVALPEFGRMMHLKGLSSAVIDLLENVKAVGVDFDV